MFDYKKIKLDLIEILIVLFFFSQTVSFYLTNINIYKNLMVLITGFVTFLLIAKLFFKTKNTNKIFMWYVALLCGYITFFAVNSYINKDLSLIAEAKQIISYMFFPLTLSYFIHFDKQSKYYNKFLCICGFLNIVVFLITMFSNHSDTLYINNGLILSLIIIYPTVLFNLINKKGVKEKVLLILLLIFSLYCIISFGNKLFTILIFCLSIYYVMHSISIKGIKSKKLNNAFLIILFLMIVIFSCYKLNLFDNNIFNNINDNYQISNNYYDTLYQFQHKPKYSENTFLKTYNIYLFNYRNETVMQKIFGVGTANSSIQNKIDPLEILCCYGLFGFTLYFFPLLYVLYQMIKYAKNNKSKFLRDNNIQLRYISIFIIILLSIFAGNVLISPVINLLCTIIISNTYSNISKMKKDSSLFLNIKNISIIILFVILLFLINKLFTKGDASLQQLNITIENESIYLDNPRLKLKKVNKKSIKSNYATDNLIYYDVIQNGKVKLKIILVSRSFSDSLIYNYITAQNISNDNIIVTIDNGKYDEYIDLDKYAKEREYSTTVGYDKTFLPSKYIIFNNKYSLGYNTYVYKTLSIDYDNINHTIIKNLVKKVNMVEFENKKIGYTFDLSGGEYFDTLVINSNDKMFKDEEEMNKFIDIYDLNLASGWLSFDGAYIKLPYSIEPYKQDGYGRNIGSNLEKGFLNYYFSDNNFFFKSHILLAIHTLKNYLPHYEESVWLTEYTSTWLSKDYGIKAFYVDTRHNDTVSGYLRAIAEYDKSDEIINMSRYYAKYLLDEYNNKNYVSFKYGILPPDYFTNGSISNTHMSLNHQLSIINNLLTTYIMTGQEEYKKLALTYLETVENIGEDWIKENKDLYYQINSNCEFDGTDYKELTLDDLLITKNLLKQIHIEEHDVLDKLIYSKIQYLIDINYNISQGLVDKLKKMGYFN